MISTTGMFTPVCCSGGKKYGGVFLFYFSFIFFSFAFGFLASWLLGFLASWLLGFSASWLLGFWASGLLGFLASWLFGFLAPGASGLPGFSAFCWFMRLLAALAFRILRAFWLLVFRFGFPHHQHHHPYLNNHFFGHRGGVPTPPQPTRYCLDCLQSNCTPI